MRKKSQIFIGTSGYSYQHWKKVFYPEDLPSSRWLEYYAKHFKTVELNVTFYRLPQETAFKSWYRRTPDDFIFVLKGSRFISHIKKLKGVKQANKLFVQRANLLKEKLGMVLWQFPPSWKKDTKRLSEFLRILKPNKIRQAFEFRNESWFCEEIYDLLKKYNFALVIADSPRYPLVEKVTADYVYIRFHGGKILYGSNYSKKELEVWAKKIKKWLKQGKDVYCYFNNDAYGYAIKNARTLANLIR